MSCPNCHANPCTCECSCDPANEAISSAFNNFTSNFFGTITKECVNGAVVWTLPCDLDDEFTGFPRNVDEPVFCYWWRTVEDIITVSACPNVVAFCALSDSAGLLANDGAGNLSWDTSDYATLTGAETLTNKELTNPATTVQTLTDAATVAWDMDLGGNATVTLGANRALGLPSNIKAGATYQLRVLGAFSLTSFDAIFKWPNNGTVPTPAGTDNLYIFSSMDGSDLIGSLVPDIA